MKNDLLFSLLGTEGTRQFSSHDLVQAIATATWDEFRMAVKEHFQQPVNKAYARLDLSQRRQGPHESASEFLSALHELAPDCQYTAPQFKEVLALQILAGCRSEDARMHMLWAEMDQNTYEDILRSEECTTSNSAAFSAAACSRPGASVSVHSDAQGAGIDKPRHGRRPINRARIVRAKPVGAVDKWVTPPRPVTALHKTMSADFATTRDTGNGVA